MPSELTRRAFVKTGAATAASVATTLSASRVFGANDRIRAGFIGIANRGGQLIDAALPHKDMEIVALCDVYTPSLDKRAKKLSKKRRSEITEKAARVRSGRRR